MITDRERQILGWIRENPSITQKELAEKAHISRSSVAVHVSNLTRKGAILGRRYILQESPYIAVVGAACIDVIGWPERDADGAEQLEGTVRSVASGSARSVAQFLAHLDHQVRLVSVFGDDANAERLMDGCRRDGVDISDSLVSRGLETASNVYMTRPNGTRRLVLRDAKAFELLTADYLAAHLDVIDRAAVCVVDSSVPPESRSFLWQNVHAPLFFAPSATDRRQPLEVDLQRPELVKLDVRLLGEVLDRELRDRASIRTAADELLSRGPLALFIPLDEGGMYCASQSERAFLPWAGGPIPQSNEFSDAMTAGIAWGWVQDLGVRRSAQAGLVAASACANARGATRVSLNDRSMRMRLGMSVREPGE